MVYNTTLDFAFFHEAEDRAGQECLDAPVGRVLVQDQTPGPVDSEDGPGLATSQRITMVPETCFFVELTEYKYRFNVKRRKKIQ